MDSRHSLVLARFLVSELSPKVADCGIGAILALLQDQASHFEAVQERLGRQVLREVGSERTIRSDVAW